jgi:hypothetical protein
MRRFLAPVLTLLAFSTMAFADTESDSKECHEKYLKSVAQQYRADLGQSRENDGYEFRGRCDTVVKTAGNAINQATDVCVIKGTWAGKANYTNDPVDPAFKEGDSYYVVVTDDLKGEADSLRSEFFAVVPARKTLKKAKGDPEFREAMESGESVMLIYNDEHRGAHRDLRKINFGPSEEYGTLIFKSKYEHYKYGMIKENSMDAEALYVMSCRK